MTDRLVTQSRIASFTASFSVCEPEATGMTFGKISRVWLAWANGDYLGTQHANAEDVEGLPSHVLCAHVDDAFEPEPRARRRGRDAVLARTGLGDDSCLPDALREQDLHEDQPCTQRFKYLHTWPMALLILCDPVWFLGASISGQRRWRAR